MTDPATDITLDFAGGSYRFALPLALLRELQTNCKAGLGAIYARVMQGSIPDDPALGVPHYAGFFIDDLFETARLGLIGGGGGTVMGRVDDVCPARASVLIDTYFAPMPVARQWDLARCILFACVEGYAPAIADADKKKAEPGTDSSTT